MIWLGARQWRLCRWSECQGCEPLPRFRDGFRARVWLHRLKDDGASMARLRDLLDDWQACGMEDDAVIDQVAEGLACGGLKVCGAKSGIVQELSGGGQTGEAAKVAEAEPLPAAASVRTPRAPEPEPPTFPPHLNGAVQASVLAAAAASGTPFCPL